VIGGKTGVVEGLTMEETEKSWGCRDF